MDNTDTFHILALDGGGTRGIYTAQLLAKIEQTFGVPIRTRFDLIAGTSTGAIIAGAAVSDIPMTDIVELFEKLKHPTSSEEGGIASRCSSVNIPTKNSRKLLPSISLQHRSAK